MDITLKRNPHTLDMVFTLTVSLHDMRGATQDTMRSLYDLDTVFNDPTSSVETRLQAVRDFLTPMLTEAL